MIVWDLQNVPRDVQLPALLLQPLLENAVYHGVEPATEGGTILVSGRYRQGVVNLAVRNSLPKGAVAARAGNRMAQANDGNVRPKLVADAARSGVHDHRLASAEPGGTSRSAR